MGNNTKTKKAIKYVKTDIFRISPKTKQQKSVKTTQISVKTVAKQLVVTVNYIRGTKFMKSTDVETYQSSKNPIRQKQPKQRSSKEATKTVASISHPICDSSKH